MSLDVPAPITATLSEGTDTRRTRSSHGWESGWNQLISSEGFEAQILSQCLRSSVTRARVAFDHRPLGAMPRNIRETPHAITRPGAWVGNDGRMPRIDLLDPDNAPITAQQYFQDGDPGPIVAALATVPEMLAPTLGFVGAALGAGAVGVRYKEFAILRTSILQGCEYCIHAHTTVALDVGLTDTEVRALRGDVPLEQGFPLLNERCLIGWIDALAGATGPIPDDVWNAARQHWPEHVLVELTITVGATMFLNRFATGLQLPTAAHVLERLTEHGLA